MPEYSLSNFDHLSRKISTPTILHHLHGDSQDSLKSDKLYQIKNLIKQNQFSETLETLELAGVTGDFALFVIQNIQTLGVKL